MSCPNASRIKNGQASMNTPKKLKVKFEKKNYVKNYSPIEYFQSLTKSITSVSSDDILIQNTTRHETTLDHEVTSSQNTTRWWHRLDETRGDETKETLLRPRRWWHCHTDETNTSYTTTTTRPRDDLEISKQVTWLATDWVLRLTDR